MVFVTERSKALRVRVISLTKWDAMLEIPLYLLSLSIGQACRRNSHFKTEKVRIGPSTQIYNPLVHFFFLKKSGNEEYILVALLNLSCLFCTSPRILQNINPSQINCNKSKDIKIFVSNLARRIKIVFLVLHTRNSHFTSERRSE